MTKYPEFLPDDEVYTTRNLRAVSINKPYRVLSCYTPDNLEGVGIKVIEVITDIGYISRYATHKFKKTERQLRDDKIKSLLLL